MNVRHGDIFQQGDLRRSGRGLSLEGFTAGIKLTVHFYSFSIEVDVSLYPSATDRDKVFDAMNIEKELS